jgi:hypothetical protein
MSQNNTRGGHSGHQGMNPGQERLNKEGDEKQRKQGETAKSHIGEEKAREGTEVGQSGRNGA